MCEKAGQEKHILNFLRYTGYVKNWLISLANIHSVLSPFAYNRIDDIKTKLQVMFLLEKRFISNILRLILNN